MVSLPGMSEPALEQDSTRSLVHQREEAIQGALQPPPPRSPQLRPVRGLTKLLDTIELPDVMLTAVEPDSTVAFGHEWMEAAQANVGSPQGPTPPQVPQLCPVRGLTKMLDPIELPDAADPALEQGGRWEEA